MHVKTNHSRPSKNLAVAFRQPFPLYTGKAYTTRVLLCNKHIDKYPKHVIGAIHSAATDHFMPETYTGDDYRPSTTNGI